MLQYIQLFTHLCLYWPGLLLYWGEFAEITCFCMFIVISTNDRDMLYVQVCETFSVYRMIIIHVATIRPLTKGEFVEFIQMPSQHILKTSYCKVLHVSLVTTIESPSHSQLCTQSRPHTKYVYSAHTGHRSGTFTCAS